MQNKSI